MHTPSTQPRPSIYYRYEVFAPWLPSAHAVQTRQPVVIVGAGPAGMVAALELARHGVASVVLSAELQLSQGSRAICFTRRSMEILQPNGLALALWQQLLQGPARVSHGGTPRRARPLFPDHQHPAAVP
jgi:3-(3-hydroxy-phenyl)propionate hydroxylase